MHLLVCYTLLIPLFKMLGEKEKCLYLNTYIFTYTYKKHTHDRLLGIDDRFRLLIYKIWMQSPSSPPSQRNVYKNKI